MTTTFPTHSSCAPVYSNTLKVHIANEKMNGGIAKLPNNGARTFKSIAPFARQIAFTYLFVMQFVRDGTKYKSFKTIQSSIFV